MKQSYAISYIGNRLDTLKGVPGGHSEAVLPYFSVDQVRSFRSMFGFLNDKDRDILFLVFVSRKKQKDVQRILGRSQPSLCYDIKRIRRRLNFIFYLHEVFDIFSSFLEVQQESDRKKVEAGLAPDFTSDEIEILTLMFYTSSFTMTAALMHISQVRARYTFNKCLKRLLDLGRLDIYEIFNIIRRDLNIVRRRCRGEKDGARLPLVV